LKQPPSDDTDDNPYRRVHQKHTPAQKYERKTQRFDPPKSKEKEVEELSKFIDEYYKTRKPCKSAMKPAQPKPKPYAQDADPQDSLKRLRK